ncbi:hypothetical protein ACFWPA_04165 [Rhodococcus sp. NPDC058505]|uniref:hypothetical protein n=1 Tax=unclassified Rhodococcus (in: high G+C Gram-positive bacteria) TaxID=192944 RepID=UPI003654895B
MNPHLRTCNDYLAATLSHDFVADGVDADAVERIHRGEVGDWVHALARSGLFANLVVANAAHAWRYDPRSLLDALIAEADEVTAKRYDSAWRAMDARRTGGYRDTHSAFAPATARSETS